MVKAKEFKVAAADDEALTEKAKTFITKIKHEVSWADEVMDSVISFKNMKQGSDKERIDSSKLELQQLENDVQQRHAMIKELTKKNSVIFTDK